MKIDNDVKLDFDDVLLVPQRSKAASRKQVRLTRNFKFYHSPRMWEGIPIMAANMDTTGTFAMSDALQKLELITCLHKYYDLGKEIDFFLHCPAWTNSWFSMGIKQGDVDRLKKLSQAIGHFPNICIDVANGYTEDFINFCYAIREMTDTAIIMAGNITTPEMVPELILHGGVDIVKVGIGPGSACTTRLKTGIGYPQFSAVMECAHAAHGLRADSGRLGLICADGGCRQPADVAKAFGAGADFVMLGGMFAGTDECEGEWEYTETHPSQYTPTEKKSLKFYGMSSEAAMNKHNGGMSNYKSSEGRVMTIPYKGLVKDVAADILGGMRSACAYTGATCLKDFSKTAKFIRVNRTHHNQKIG